MPYTRLRRPFAAATLTSLVAASLTTVALASPAHAAPVQFTVLTMNDFHGRIDDNTTKFATTIEQIRAAKGETNTLLVSGGDNIGASLFASAYAEDEPTVKVLNALDLSGSAVGNHGFDRGYQWLQEKPLDNPPEASTYTAATWPILGANVHQAATGDPALEESYTVDKAGLHICVAGAVTQETPTLVNPSGIEGLEFTEPVASVNDAVAALEAIEPCDLTIATYHEGATDGDATLEENVARGGAFADIVNKTDASVDVIVTGHTHQAYAYAAPIPGGTGTRPVIQTGSYGENVGQVDLTVDDATGAVTAHTEMVVPRAAAEDLTFPRVQEVKTIVDDAMAEADAIGNQAVGQITDDITTAYEGGTYGPDGYVPPNPADPTEGRDQRGLESTMGHTVADMLRETPIEGQPTPDLGITNPGGLRAELFYAGDTSTSPANTDGVVTFEEANAVLPFVNNISYVDVTGETLVRILEQQWQPADASRPFLALGLSKNVHVTLDESRPEGQRVRSLTINGEGVRRDQHYLVSTFSFLASGGDNFTAFTEGTATDTGKIDRELWIDGYLGNGQAKSPDYTRREVYTDAPRRVTEHRRLDFTMSQLDLTSLGTPANSRVRAVLVKPGRNRTLATFPITDGSAAVQMRAPRRAPRGSSLRFVTDATHNKVEVAIRQVRRHDSNMRVHRRPEHVVAGQTHVRIRAKVRSEGMPARGRVRVRAGGGRIFTHRLNDHGVARFRLPTFKHTGRKTVRVRYLGRWNTQPSREVLRFRVRHHR